MKNAGHIIDLNGGIRHSNEIWVTHFDQDATVQFYEQFLELKKSTYSSYCRLYLQLWR